MKKFLARLFGGRPSPERPAWAAVKLPPGLTRVLVVEYAQLKRERGWIDMGDLERAALALMSGSNSSTIFPACQLPQASLLVRLTGPSMVGVATLPPRTASARVIGRVRKMSSPSRRNRGSGATVRVR